MSYLETYQEWLHSPALSPAEKAELESIANDPKEIESRFFDQLSFGTAGLRGTMCTGLHQMNVHVIRHTTQAFAEVVKAEGVDACAKGVAVCFDCRNHSAEFAKEAACVMAGNGIQVRLFEAMRPTPELSFAIRKYGCQAGINVTASHNPKEYNGYKVYWEDGAQLPPKHADAIAAKMKELDVFGCVQQMDYDQAVAEGRIVLMGKETDEAFLSEVLNMVNDRACVAAGGRPVLPGLHPLPRHRLPAHPGSPEAAGYEARALRAGTDGHRRQLPHGGLPQPGESGRVRPGGGAGQEEPL